MSEAEHSLEPNIGCEVMARPQSVEQQTFIFSESIGLAIGVTYSSLASLMLPIHYRPCSHHWRVRLIAQLGSFPHNVYIDGLRVMGVTWSWCPGQAHASDTLLILVLLSSLGWSG